MYLNVQNFKALFQDCIQIWKAAFMRALGYSCGGCWWNGPLSLCQETAALSPGRCIFPSSLVQNSGVCFVSFWILVKQHAKGRLMEKLHFQLPGKYFSPFSMKTKRSVSWVVWREEEVNVPCVRKGLYSALFTGSFSGQAFIFFFLWGYLLWQCKIGHICLQVTPAQYSLPVGPGHAALLP